MASFSGRWNDLDSYITPDGKYFVYTFSTGFSDEPRTKKLTYREFKDRIRNPQNGFADI